VKKENPLDRKVKLVYHDLEGRLSTESIWVEKEGQYYRVKNIPFFAPNIAYNDLISVEEDNEELFFDNLIKPSGHSTIQIIFFDLQHFEQITHDLVTLHCAWEGSHLKEYISVDVPKEVHYGTVRKYLIQKRDEKQLDFREACLAHEYDSKLPDE
jgi:hypothetical protein